MLIVIAMLLFALCILISVLIAKVDDILDVTRILMHTHTDICNAMLDQDGKIGFIQKMVAAFYEREFEDERKKITY